MNRRAHGPYPRWWEDRRFEASPYPDYVNTQDLGLRPEKEFYDYP